MNRPYDEYKDFVNAHLLDFIPDIDNKSISLYEAMKYSLAAGGKRLRPVLMLASCEFAGGDINEALPFACAMEYIHTYSLIHDDLPAMDDDDLRRGLPTNHKVFGEAIAILAGDGLLNTAFEAISKDMLLYLDSPEKMSSRIKAMYEIAKGSGVRGMVSGQVSDIEGEHMRFSSEMLEYMQINKTAAIIIASVKAGLCLANAPYEMINDFEKYAENLGLAFQIADDILDETGTPEELGKSVRTDQRHEKNTYTSLNGLDAAYNRLNDLTDAASEAIAKYEDADFFRELVIKLRDRKK